MPKLKQSAEAVADTYLRATIKKYLAIANLDYKQAGACSRMSERSFYNRMRNPSDLKLSELRALCKKGKIPTEEIIRGIIPG